MKQNYTLKAPFTKEMEHCIGLDRALKSCLAVIADLVMHHQWLIYQSIAY